MLISRAEIYGGAIADVRIEDGCVVAIGPLSPRLHERVLHANGGVMLPGLHDHHMHLMAYAASLESVPCGPPAVTCESRLVDALESHRPQREDGWTRGIGYHESVAGEIDRCWLDRVVGDRPVRIQHRSGRLWILNSAALDIVGRVTGADASAAIPRDGRLYDRDELLTCLPQACAPPFGEASRRLASYGITGFTDMTPRNDAAAMAWFTRLQRQRDLLQRVQVAGKRGLSRCAESTRCLLGPAKVHLHEASLPSFEDLRTLIKESHADGRAVAVHCVTETELVFALAALCDASPAPGDRIEHASIAPRELVEQMRELGVLVVTQPNFIAERGDEYLDQLPVCDHNSLYRCRSFLSSAIPLAGGTDAPFGDADPWNAMRAAVARETRRGRVLGTEERLTPEQALGLFLGSLESPAETRRVEVGMEADLCLLDRPWAQARLDLSSTAVRATFSAGELLFDRVDQPPG